LPSNLKCPGAWGLLRRRFGLRFLLGGVLAFEVHGVHGFSFVLSSSFEGGPEKTTISQELRETNRLYNLQRTMKSPQVGDLKRIILADDTVIICGELQNDVVPPVFSRNWLPFLSQTASPKTFDNLTPRVAQ